MPSGWASSNTTPAAATAWMRAGKRLPGGKRGFPARRWGGLSELVVVDHAAQPGQRPVLRHSHVARGDPERFGGFLRREADGDAQGQDFLLYAGQRGEQPAEAGAEVEVQRVGLGLVAAGERALRELGDGLGAVAGDGAVGVGDLV